MKYICLPTMLIARRTTILGISLSLSLTSAAQQKPSPLSPYVKEDAPVLVLEHVRLIDGTGSAPQEDMRIVIAGGKITAVQAASAHNPYPPNAKVLEMTGKTVIPGLVGMH
jgi:imidazolonepropionase-like amidohydrolase